MSKSFLAGFIFCLFNMQYLNAQELLKVTENKFTYRPIVKNNRVLWFETNQQVPGLNQVSIYLFEKGSNKLITSIGSVLFTGWPDLDDAGMVAYMKKAGSRHEVFLYDGAKETQITNNPAINKLVIDMGLATDKVYCGYPRIHNGDIVFKDTAGHIYLYLHKTKSIKKITTDASQIANVGDDEEKKASTGLAAPKNAHIKYFEFDGNHITWMHEDRFGSNGSKISIYTADTGNKFVPKLINSFDAWVPNNKGTVISKLWNPFFKACNGFIIWQYYVAGPAINIDDTRVGFYNGKTSKTISSGTYVAEQSVQVADGKAIWWRVRKKGEGKNVMKFDELILYVKDSIHVVASYPEPPKQSNTGTTFWEGILDAEILAGDVFWVMNETECFQQFTMPVTKAPYCMYKKTSNVGFFRSSFSQDYPFRLMDDRYFAGGGEFDRGLYTFFSTESPGTRDISAVQLYGDTGSSKSLVTVFDRKEPDEIIFDLGEKQRKRVVDAFSIEYGQIRGCGEPSLDGEVILESLTLDVLVEKQPVARFDDIKTLWVYLDVNKNGVVDDTTDRLLAAKHSPVYKELLIMLNKPKEAIHIKNGDPVYFVVVMEMIEDVCPCGKYRVVADGKKMTFKKTTGGTVTAFGISNGGITMAVAKIKEIKGDEQAGLPGQKLRQNLSVVYENLPIRCGQAKFKIIQQPPESGAFLKNGNKLSNFADELIIDFIQQGRDAVAAIEMVLGSKEGLYNVSVSIKPPVEMRCKNDSFIFREHAGKMTMQIVDLNNEDFFNATEDRSNPDFAAWKATMSSDVDKLSFGGQGRNGAFADGASMLLVRFELIGFTEPPKGDIKLSLTGKGNIGHLTPGLGEEIPSYQGGSSIAVQWKKAKTGVFGFVLFTPPLNFGEVSEHSRNIHLSASYYMPGTNEPIKLEDDIVLYKPPIIFIHGFTSNNNKWGQAFLQEDPLWHKINFDYEWASGYSFGQLGNLVEDEIKKIIRGYRNNRVAATKVNMVAHSMGGLIVRQFFRDNNSLNYHRKNNFGKGDIYKLICIGVPHFGSPVAWLVNTLRATPYGAAFTATLESLGIKVNQGGMDAMCPGSAELEALGATYIPSHNIRGWVVDASNEKILKLSYIKQAKSLLLLALKDQPDRLFFEGLQLNIVMILIQTMISKVLETGITGLYSSDRTDLLVTLESQSGGIAQGKTFDYSIHMSFDKPIRKYSHGTIDLSGFFETSKKEIADYVFSILMKNVDDINIFAHKLPKPDIQDPAISCK